MADRTCVEMYERALSRLRLAEENLSYWVKKRDDCKDAVKRWKEILRGGKDDRLEDDIGGGS